MTPATRLPAVGERIDRYEVLAPLAQGGMAAVYAVRRSSVGGFDKLLAMKVMLPQVCGDPQIINLFLDEARIAATIDHPNVVQVLDVGGAPDQPFLVMEYLRGQSLSRVKRLPFPLPTNLVLHVVALAAEGLHAAHEALDPDGASLGIVHRDVSPQNIVVTYQGDVKVVDFGIAAARGRLTETRTGEVRGKLAYLAPEALTKSAPVDRRADVWALGIVAWELLAGRSLFRGEDEASTLWNVIHQSVDHIAEICPDLPAVAAEAIMRCLERKLDARLADARALARAFQQAADELPTFRRSDLAAFMTEHFAAEADEEQTRLAAALEDATVARADGETQVTVEAAIDPPASSRSFLGWGIVAAAAIGASLFAWRMADPAAEVVHPGLALAAPAVAQPITLHIGPGVRLVLVDGLRHDERPVVTDDRHRFVEVLLDDGQTRRYALDAQLDGKQLPPSDATAAAKPDGPAVKPPAPARRSKPATESKPSASSSKPAFVSPYQ